MNRILELEQRITILEKKIDSIEGKQITMRDVEEDMEIKRLARRIAMGDKEAIKEHRRKFKQGIIA